ncbi:META domain-containing protein (plasmid) [Falsihalocynthiibacter sp. SS001]|uniref:META domain-containing protein n=1 Tax=Falsihalocynthiibacter sp. SS001 TaxID=3349698 RepID=UPI0036D3C096
MKRIVTPLLLAMSTATCPLAAGADDLGGTAWRLVEIQSMDDSVLAPDDTSKYTLEFMPDGTTAIQADCNRGAGTWTSAAANELSFGPIASTRALCPEGSISDKYLAQFEWVRSYTLEDGGLFLATMADGAIIEFTPVASMDKVATVLGEDLTTTDADELQFAILGRLFDQYAQDQGIEAEPDEIDAFLEKMRSGTDGASSDRDELTSEEAAEVEAMENDMATSMIRQWKINKSLHDQYGGRIIYQQLGPEPLDAYLAFLKERQSAGDFVIHDQTLADAFWNTFTDESKHDFIEPGSDEEANAFSTPIWEQGQ